MDTRAQRCDRDHAGDGSCVPGRFAPNTQAFFTNQKLRSGLNRLGTENANDAGIAINPVSSRRLNTYGPNAPIFDKVSYSVPSDSGGGPPQNTYSTLNRVDYHMSDSTKMFFRYALFSQNEFAGFLNNSPYVGYDTGQTNFNNNFMYSVTHVWSPRLVTETKLLFNRLNNTQPLASTQPVQPTSVFQLERGRWNQRRPDQFAWILATDAWEQHSVRWSSERC